MRHYPSTFLLVLIAASALKPISASAGGVLPLGQAEYNFIYDRLERHEIFALDRYDYQCGPYLCSDIDCSVAPFADIQNVPASRLSLFGFIDEDFRSGRFSRPQGFERMRGGGSGEPLNNLFIYSAFVLDERRARDEKYRGKKWRGFAGDVEYAFGSYQTNRVHLLVGRFSQFWGERQSLFLSPERKLDGFAYALKWGNLTVSYRLARLDGLNTDIDAVAQFENRYFAGHRLDMHFSPQFRLGLIETVIFGGVGRQLDLFYLNPIIFYHGSQLNEDVNDNTLLGFDFTYKPARGYKFFGQLLIDDIQLDNKSRGDKEPTEMGILLTGYIADVLPSYDLTMDYSRVTNWTFNQIAPRNRYTIDNNLIGAALGNDYDLSTISLTRWFGTSVNSSLTFRYLRQGEGSIDAIWSEPWITAEGAYTEPFPTGVVEKIAIVSAGLKGFVKTFGFFDIETGIEQIRNQGHVNGKEQTVPFFQLKISTFFSKIISIE